MVRDTMCGHCTRWTHINTERGEGLVFCDQRCKDNYIARHGKPSLPYCIAGQGWFPACKREEVH